MPPSYGDNRNFNETAGLLRAPRQGPFLQDIWHGRPDGSRNFREVPLSAVSRHLVLRRPHRDSFPNLQAALTSRALSPVQMSLSQFILNPCAVTNRSFTHLILAHITHLDIPYQEKGDWDWASLELLRSLTHLSIDVYHWDPAQVARDAVQWCPNGLRVLALCLSCDWLASCDDVTSLVRGDVDPRIIAISFRSNLPGLELNFRLSFKELLDGWKRPSINSKL